MRGNWAFAVTLNEPDWVSDSVLVANKRSAVAPSMNEADLGFRAKHRKTVSSPSPTRLGFGANLGNPGFLPVRF